jgi:uridine kinase
MTYDGCFNVLIVPLDCFYKGLDKTKVNPKDYNFDHPDALDFGEAYNCLVKLMNGEKAAIPRYNFVTHSQEEEKDIVEPTEVILFEGILSLYDARIRDLMQYKIFMHCDGTQNPNKISKI